MQLAAYQLKKCGISYLAYFNFDEADRKRKAWLAAEIPNPNDPAPADPDEGDDSVGPLGEAQAKERHFKALMAELEYRKRLGELVERSAVEAEAFRIGRQVRDTQKNIPARFCDTLAAEIESIVVDMSKDLPDGFLSSFIDRLRHGFDKRKIYEILEAEITKSQKALALDDDELEPELPGGAAA